MTKNVNYLSQKKSKQVVNGMPKLPLANDLSDGELAINYAKGFETIAIKNESGDVVTFSSDNYISTNYYNKSEVDDLISASSGGSGGTYISVNADWDELDEEAPSFIQNKPFGESFEVVNIYTNPSKGLSQCGQHCFGAFEGSMFGGLVISETLVDGDVYTVNVNGNEFVITASTYSGTIGLNWSGNYNNVETVAVWGNGTEVSISINDTYLNGNTDNASISITRKGNSIKKLDNKYLDLSDYYTKTEVDGKIVTSTAGFKQVINTTDSTKIGLVSNLSQYYNTNIGGFAVIEGTGYQSQGGATDFIEAAGNAAHAEGLATFASGDCSHAEGSYTKASGASSHAEGIYTKASGASSHAEGYETTANGNSSHAEGYETKANGIAAHAEGRETLANGYSSHAEGQYTHAAGQASHAEGQFTTANTLYSHAEGQNTNANGVAAHAEGYYTTAKGDLSHAEGEYTIASGETSHAEGYRTIANNISEHASGQFNVSSKANNTFGNSGNTLFSVGNGTSDSARHNAFEIRQNGDIYITKNGSDVKLQDQLGGGSSTNVVILSQSEYDALANKDNNTIYVIK